MKRPPLDWPAGPALLAGCIVFGLAGCQRAAPAEEEEHKPPAPVKAVPLQRLALGEHTELFGATQALPHNAARVTAPLAGQVLWVLNGGPGKPVVEGQQVEKGQVIVQLDDRVIRTSRDKAQAALEDILAQKRQADVAMQLARVERDRLDKLLPGSPNGSIPLVPAVELEKAKLAYQDAEAKRAAVLAKERVARAELEALDVQLEYHKLRVPIAGHLGTVHAMPGETLSAGAAVAEVVDLREIDVVCLVPPASAARLALGQSAGLAADHGAAPQESGPVGKVVYIAVQAQADTGNFLVKVRFPNPDLRLRANTVARVGVLTQPEEQRATLPEAALMEDEDEPAVVVVEHVHEEKHEEKEETVGEAKKLRPILGVRDREKHLVEILGLEDPEKKEKVSLDGLLFVVEGGHGLHDGDEVRIEKEETEK